MALDPSAWRDVELARVEVPRWIGEVADARGWSSDARATALADAEAAYAAADAAAYFGADLRTYWATLSASVTSSGTYATLPGGVAYVNTIVGALETLDAEEAQRARTGFLGVLGGIGAAAGAVGDAAGDTAKKVLDPRFVWGVAAIVIAVAVIKVAPRSGRA
mgnify:CR=1 FL=1